MFYCEYVSAFLKGVFPGLVSYERIVYLQKHALIPLCAYLKSRYGKPSRVAFIDSAKIAVCHNMRINRHKIFASWAKRGKTSTGWFYGFKIHLVINESGELLSVQCIPGNVTDRKSVPYLTDNLTGLLIADRGYLCQPLFESLYARGLKLVTTVHKNMKAKLLYVREFYLLRKRTLVETVIDQLKNIS
jgi:hypothetical protein